MPRRLSQSLAHGAEYDAEEGGAAAGVATLLALPAAQRGLASVIYLLHEFGGTMEKQDMDRGGPPLMHAANNGHASTVTALLKVRCKARFQRYLLSVQRLPAAALPAACSGRRQGLPAEISLVHGRVRWR